jgi:hypothetical protein
MIGIGQDHALEETQFSWAQLAHVGSNVRFRLDPKMSDIRAEIASRARSPSRYIDDESDSASRPCLKKSSRDPTEEPLAGHSRRTRPEKASSVRKAPPT